MNHSNARVFYSKNHNVWLWSGFVLIVLLGICAYVSVQEWDDPFYLLLPGFFSVIFLILTVLIWNNDQRFRLKIFDEGIKIGRKPLIAWQTIRSIHYTKQISYESKLTDVFTHNNVITYIHCDGDVKIILNKFSRQSSDVFDIQSCIDSYFNPRIHSRTLLPQMNELITYDQSIVMKRNYDWLSLCGGFGFGGLGLISLLQIGPDLVTIVSFCAGVVFVGLYYLLRSGEIQKILITRKIALKMTEEGIQDEWLMKHNVVIPWSHIEGVDIGHLSHLSDLSQKCLLVHLSDHSVYESTLSWWQKMHYRFIQLRHYPAVFVCEHIENYLLQDIEQVLNQNL